MYLFVFIRQASNKFCLISDLVISNKLKCIDKLRETPILRKSQWINLSTSWFFKQWKEKRSTYTKLRKGSQRDRKKKPREKELSHRSQRNITSYKVGPGQISQSLNKIRNKKGLSDIEI